MYFRWLKLLVKLSSKDAHGVLEFKNSLVTRLTALAAAHELMHGIGEGRANLDGLLRQELAPYRSLDGNSFRIGGPELTIGRSAALTFALVFHELATNSAKYGALSTPTGRIDVSWNLIGVDDNRWLTIDWRESGGPSVSPPMRQGFGTRLINQAIARFLRADVSIEYAPTGLVCLLRLPWEAIQPMSEARQ